MGGIDMGNKVVEEVEEYYDVKMSKKEMLKVLALYYGEEASYEVLEHYARNRGGLPYHILECYENANKEVAK
jgi:hypothetical protein